MLALARHWNAENRYRSRSPAELRQDGPHPVLRDGTRGSWQVEPHTCRFHAVSSIYLASGLDAEAAKLRFRFGTDKPGTNFDSESVGTIRPDILRVVRQDGSDATTHLLMNDDTARAIREHLRSGDPVLAMIRVTGLHWIFLTGIDGDDVIVCDSLKDGLLREPFNEFVLGRVKNAILSRPSP